MENNKTAWQKSWEAVRKWLWFWADLVESLLHWWIKWVTWTASMVWEWAAYTTDFLTDLLTWWKHWTSLWNKEWFLDKLDKKANEKLNQSWDWDLIKSDLWQTDTGKILLWAADTVWQIAVPYTWAFKWLKIWKKGLDIIKNTPKAKKELQLLSQSKWRVTQSQVDDILKKYSWDVKNKVQTWYSVIADKTWKQKQIYDKIKKFTPEQIEKLPLTLKQKLWRLWLYWTLWTGIIWYEAQKQQWDTTWITMDSELEDNNLTDEEIKILESLDNKETTTQENTQEWSIDYKWRKFEKTSDWKIWFQWMDWVYKTFNSEQEAKDYIDKNVKQHNIEVIKNIFKSNDPIQEFIKTFWLNENPSEDEIYKKMEEKWISIDEFKKILESIKQ